MARQARGEVIDPTVIQIVHAVQRCVRRAFLCGQDATTGNSYNHRRKWIRDRLEFLASTFGIDCLTYTVLSNHLHIVLRSRPDVVATWSDKEVAERWLYLFPARKEQDGSPAKPSLQEMNALIFDKKVLAERRRRLSDVSWWMRCLAEVIARQANREDKCTGRFWEGRFKSQLILDEASLLACAAYVDLNPIRAAMAESLETSEFTGVKDRIDDLANRESPSKNSHAWERSQLPKHSGWMSPIEINERCDSDGPDVCHTGRRASQKGFLAMSLESYLELLDWTSRQLHSEKPGRTPAHLSPILDRLGITSESWQFLVLKFGRIFKRAAGTRKQLSSEANRRGQKWMQSPGNPLKAAA